MNHLSLFLKGLAMGAADVVPGVSGGTVAFITGIYERLINAIKSANLNTLETLFKKGFAPAWKQLDGTFLVVLFAGIFTSLLSLARVLKSTMTTYPQLLWAFFFGLIIASAIYIFKQIERWDKSAIVGLIAGTIIAYGVTILSPTEAPNTYTMVFLAGAIAICAMILPGISGSFILLLMGMYGHILTAVTDFDIGLLLVFLAGCIIGLLAFSRVLSWTFQNYKNTTLAILTGFMVGSLNKVWPWQNIEKFRLDSHGNQVPWIMKNTSPANYEGEAYLWICLGLIVLGFAMVFLLEKLGSDESK